MAHERDIVPGAMRRYGVLTFASGPLDEVVRAWREVEELGLDSAWLVDTFAYPGLVDYEPWTLLAALAREVRRLRIGTLITHIAFRHPTLLAAETLTLDRLSDGRVELGLGVGEQGPDWAAVGLEAGSSRERVARLAEHLELLDRLLRGERVDHVGRFFRAEAVQLAEPVQRPRPPLVIAAQVPASLRLAARFADTWNTLGGQPQTSTGLPRLPMRDAVERTRAQMRRLDELCRELGRDPASIRRSLLALRADPDPLSSLGAFDTFVGAYADAGIQEFIFYWPPLANLRRREPITRHQRSTLERIAAERIAATSTPAT
jgi:alkanesulfonate monooxygenase SsuD/methylene tetrahydromethanopterin reductase-like flavin-dependent oxidoreductase (luciferase family)